MAADDIFDVVNDSDEVIGELSRGEVHRLGLMHRAVHVLVFNPCGEVFLQKRSRLKDTHPGVWDSSASGHLDRGEAYDACAVREAAEEIGIGVGESLERLFKVDACDHTGMEFVWVYRASSSGPFTLQAEEVEAGGWFRPAVVDAWLADREADFAPAFAMIWRRISATHIDLSPQ